jgi:hypothetical protein
MGGLLNSLLVQFKGQRAINRLSEDNLIATVLEEQKNGEVDQVALAKAQMEAEGDTKKSDALYIKHRIQRIKDGYYASEAIDDIERQKATWHNSKAFDSEGNLAPSRAGDEDNRIRRKHDRIALLLPVVLLVVFTVLLALFYS